jgi:multidrug efflux pump subunit AcrB
MDTVQANRLLQEHWTELGPRFPNLDLDFSGELDDIQESLGAMLQLMLLGVLLMYLILGTQFRSYFQPFLILATVPMAFTGVVVGLLITANPLSLYTLYGVVALAGIAVNSAIVLISAANQRLQAGMSVLHATIYAARRRVIPILITSLTTVAGLFSLATGLGGKSLLWGPVATAIVWGLTVSTTLTLFVVPLLYRQFMRRKALQRTPIQA